MLLIGLLLVIVALVVGAAVVLDATESATLHVFGVDWHTTGAGVFLAGAATMLALLLGVWLMQLGLARARRRRKEVKGLKRDAKSANQLEQDKASLAAELEHERTARSDEIAAEERSHRGAFDKIGGTSPVSPGDDTVRPNDGRRTLDLDTPKDTPGAVNLSTYEERENKS